MSKEISETAPKRRYRKRRRAEQEDETRLRITEAAVDLHGSVGPARTTISAVAEAAGVQRATVYRHFPDEASLFAACSGHWLAQNPPPDFGSWASVDDPGERLRLGLSELYKWYGGSAGMLEKTTRDAALVPAMSEPMAAFAAGIDAAAEALFHGRSLRGRRRELARAAIGHAVSFATWNSLVREQGLSAGEAVELMAATVQGAESGSSRTRAGR
jgi:AcrR family transcriptional regulator